MAFSTTQTTVYGFGMNENISVPLKDPVGSLMPHTLKEPLLGRDSGPLAGRTFMVKDLFAIAGRKVSNGNPRISYMKVASQFASSAMLPSAKKQAAKISTVWIR